MEKALSLRSKLLAQLHWRRGVGIVFLLLALFGVWDQWREKEIALLIGEPWEDMRQRSSASIDPAISGHNWFRMPKSDARLRFVDPQYGFITPAARFFTVSFSDDESISSLRMSPQVEPLLLDDALAVALDLQEQWRNAGWKPIFVDRSPSYADTPQWRARMREGIKTDTTHWQAGDKYQVMLLLARFRDDKRPTEERYLLTLELADAWRKH